jgi:hypothetical protein
MARQGKSRAFRGAPQRLPDVDGKVPATGSAIPSRAKQRNMTAGASNVGKIANAASTLATVKSSPWLTRPRNESRCIGKSKLDEASRRGLLVRGNWASDFSIRIFAAASRGYDSDAGLPRCTPMIATRFPLIVSTLAVAVGALPVAAAAQTPSYATRTETIRGTIASVESLNHLLVADDRGYTDDVTLRLGAAVASGGVRLVPGERVAITGAAHGATFLATRIATSGSSDYGSADSAVTTAAVPAYYPAPVYYAAPVYYGYGPFSLGYGFGYGYRRHFIRYGGYYGGYRPYRGGYRGYRGTTVRASVRVR